MRTLLSVLLIALAVAAAGCGGGGSNSPSPARNAATVAIRGFKYVPPTITVRAGARVTFTNFDAAPHTATAAGLDTGTLRKGQSRTVTPAKAGTYAYVCQFHPYMHGTIVVD